MIVLRENFYSNRKQKELRRQYDIEQSSAYKTLSKEQIEQMKPEQVRQALQEGRRKNRRNNNITSTLDSSINSKSANSLDALDGTLTADARRLVNNSDEVTLSKRGLKKIDRSGYDHGTIIPSRRAGWNKEVMEIRKDKAKNTNGRSISTPSENGLRELDPQKRTAWNRKINEITAKERTQAINEKNRKIKAENLKKFKIKRIRNLAKVMGHRI